MHGAKARLGQRLTHRGAIPFELLSSDRRQPVESLRDFPSEALLDFDVTGLLELAQMS